LNIASIIDHTLLKPEATKLDMQTLCQDAEMYGFAAVCVHPPYVEYVFRLLRHTPVNVCSVVGFPFGAHLPEVKVHEAHRAVEDGARELDMVINIGALKSGDPMLVERDMHAVVDACRGKNVVVKAILETSLLTDEEKIRACQLALNAGVDFVKTSTGLGSRGVTEKDVRLLKKILTGSSVGIKAAGGIRTYDEAVRMVKAGASRIGTSWGVQIVEQERMQRKNRSDARS